jgi:hypothetical protein
MAQIMNLNRARRAKVSLLTFFIHKKSGKRIPIPRHSEIENKLVKDILKEIPKD